MCVFPAIEHSPGVDVEMDRLAALAAFGRSTLKWGNGRVLTPYRKRLNRLPISPWGPIAMGMKE